MAELNELSVAIINGDMEEARKLTQALLDQGLPAGKIVSEGLIPGMNEVGRLFKACEYYVPEVLISARAMKSSMELVRPLLSGADSAKMGKIVIGTVQGDLHDIGKNLVAMMLEGAGFEVVDLATDVSPAKFVEAVKQHKPKVVAMSALLTTTMTAMKSTIEALKEAGVRTDIKVMVGGAPVTERFAHEIGADGYAPEAATATDVAKNLTAA
jgi:5-methyltetrahydrofolate--homocysteine methyltransferase